MFRILLLGMLTAVGWLPATAGAQGVPVIYTFVLDATGSVSESDFRAENAAVARYLEVLYEKSQNHPDELADWVSIHYFGGDREYEGTPYFNASDRQRVRLLQYIAIGKKHPNYGSTHIYTAIAKAAYQALQHDESIPYHDFFHVIILITDGEDNGSRAQFRDLVQEVFPSNKFFLAIVGVGKAQVTRFETVANETLKIEDFGGLVFALELVIEAVRQTLYR